MCAPYQCAQSKKDIGNNSQAQDNIQSLKTTDGQNQINYALRIAHCALKKVSRETIQKNSAIPFK